MAGCGADAALWPQLQIQVPTMSRNPINGHQSERSADPDIVDQQRVAEHYIPNLKNCLPIRKLPGLGKNCRWGLFSKDFNVV